MRQAIELSREGMLSGVGGPFGAVVVTGGAILASGQNRVLADNDPTAHAEIVAIRAACRLLDRFQLVGCELYTSCEPCPMCLGAIHWSRLERVHYANTRADAADIGFDDDRFHRELGRPLADRAIPMHQLLRDEALLIFQEWKAKPDKQGY